MDRKIKCELTGEECFQHTGLQCKGESKDCYYKQYGKNKVIEDKEGNIIGNWD